VDLAEVIPVAQLAALGPEDPAVPLGRLLALCDLLYDLAHLAGVQGAGHEVAASAGPEPDDGVGSPAG
jgi:hypothetical protein